MPCALSGPPAKKKARRRIPSGPSSYDRCAIYLRRLGAQWGPSMSFTLSDTQVAAITSIARPLAGEERRQFMAALFENLFHRREELGDGSLGRLLHDLQLRHHKPPTLGEIDRHERGLP
jgi:hypothetical protein